MSIFEKLANQLLKKVVKLGQRVRSSFFICYRDSSRHSLVYSASPNLNPASDECSEALKPSWGWVKDELLSGIREDQKGNFSWEFLVDSKQPVAKICKNKLEISDAWDTLNTIQKLEKKLRTLHPEGLYIIVLTRHQKDLNIYKFASSSLDSIFLHEHWDTIITTALQR